MKPWAELTAGARGARVGGVVAVIAAILWGAFSLRGSPERGPEGDDKPAVAEAEAGKVAPAPEPAAEAAPAPEAPAAAEEPAAPAESAAADPAAEPAAEPAAAPAAEPAAAPAEAVAEPAAPALPAPPTLDVVRIEQDGSAVIAGKGAPGSTLSLRVDGAEVVAIPADASGNFVAMFSLPPSDAARALSVVMVLADGTEIPAAATVAIAPTVAPVIAQAETATATAEPAQPTDTAEAQTTEPAVAEPTAAEPTATEPAEAPAALMVTDEGAKVLQGIGDGTVAAANVTVDAISYTPEGAVVLAGRGTAGALVRLYLDNAATAEATVARAGDWSVTLADIKPGIYTLRVDQVDAEGKVTSRFETPFKRESLEALAAAAAPAAEPAVAPAVTEPAATPTQAAAPEPATTAPEVATTAAKPAAEPTAALTATTEVAAAEPAAADPEPAAATEAVAEAPAAEPAPTAQAPAPIQITVQPGYTLWRIARENLGDGIMYVQVFEANKDQIRDPDLIYPGQIFTLAPKE